MIGPSNDDNGPEPLRLLRERARMRGRADERLGLRTHEKLYPPGAEGHGDYELGHQDIELLREKRQQMAAQRRARRFKRPSAAVLRAGRAFGHPKP